MSDNEQTKPKGVRKRPAGAIPAPVRSKGPAAQSEPGPTLDEQADAANIERHVGLRERISQARRGLPPLPAEQVAELKAKHGHIGGDPSIKTDGPPDRLNVLPEFKLLAEYLRVIDLHEEALKGEKRKWHEAHQRAVDRYESDRQVAFDRNWPEPEPPHLEPWPYEQVLPDGYGVDLAFKKFERMREVVWTARKKITAVNADRYLEMLQPEYARLEARVEEARQALQSAESAASQIRSDVRGLIGAGGSRPTDGGFPVTTGARGVSLEDARARMAEYEQRRTGIRPNPR